MSLPGKTAKFSFNFWSAGSAATVAFWVFGVFGAEPFVGGGVLRQIEKAEFLPVELSRLGVAPPLTFR